MCPPGSGKVFRSTNTYFLLSPDSEITSATRTSSEQKDNLAKQNTNVANGLVTLFCIGPRAPVNAACFHHYGLPCNILLPLTAVPAACPALPSPALSALPHLRPSFGLAPNDTNKIMADNLLVHVENTFGWTSAEREHIPSFVQALDLL